MALSTNADQRKWRQIRLWRRLLLQILDLEHSKREIEQTYQSRLAELQQATSSPDLTHVLESHTHEIEQMRATHMKLTNMIAELENARQEKNEEIAALQSRLAAVEAVERKNELLETSNKSLEYELEVEKEQTRVRCVINLQFPLQPHQKYYITQ